MQFLIAFTMALLASGAALAAGPANPPDRYDYDMHVTNKDGYVPDAARSTDKFDPYTQGANQSTRSNLTSAKDKMKHTKSGKKTAPAHPSTTE
ncbi:hypothetical protein BKK79_03820 [Cupriavidus sp. USMAA2-4]|uniref:Uncharacterized protein n=1 Tax=Cupriavidus malaysiensis TaxID=367825 RepID=A0A1D9I1M8_9BURK|nr:MULTISPECIES: hypothetical protein [Cupriavidus]AOY91038.1 hypothetical protein BKK79_03820 [Cupriavidus sp. USMAA2-4]AOY99387.1 hypothetical protein BKK81_09010 [Cupriavidus sp. USMAHM13]AOZ06004.1 hypothetical protein BKK80_09295 [Cupriavidus malaysiensis]